MLHFIELCFKLKQSNCALYFIDYGNSNSSYENVFSLNNLNHFKVFFVGMIGALEARNDLEKLNNNILEK